jgi:hypothetical protein
VATATASWSRSPRPERHRDARDWHAKPTSQVVARLRAPRRFRSNAVLPRRLTEVSATPPWPRSVHASASEPAGGPLPSASHMIIVHRWTLRPAAPYPIPHLGIVCLNTDGFAEPAAFGHPAKIQAGRAPETVEAAWAAYLCADIRRRRSAHRHGCRAGVLSWRERRPRGRVGRRGGRIRRRGRTGPGG